MGEFMLERISAVATKNCASDPRIAQSCEKRMRAKPESAE